LWFLYVLLLFYAAALALRSIASLAAPLMRIVRNRLDPALGAVSRIGIAPQLLAMPAFLLLAAKPDWVVRAGIPTPDFGLVPNPIALVAYGSAFGFGWLLHRRQDLLAFLRRDWPVQLAIAVAATLTLAWALRADEFFATEADGSRRALHAGLYMIGAWAWSAAIIGTALRFLTAERAAIRYIADASYWIYLVHLPVVMALAVAVYPLQAPALAKFGLVIAASFLILFASYHLLVRHSWVGRWLNGRKHPWARNKPELEARPA
jgi:peptidoglycan/LPS O-acetylase OafA/YrhL